MAKFHNHYICEGCGITGSEEVPLLVRDMYYEGLDRLVCVHCSDSEDELLSRWAAKDYAENAGPGFPFPVDFASNREFQALALLYERVAHDCFLLPNTHLEFENFLFYRMPGYAYMNRNNTIYKALCTLGFTIEEAAILCYDDSHEGGTPFFLDQLSPAGQDVARKSEALNVSHLAESLTNDELSSSAVTTLLLSVTERQFSTRFERDFMERHYPEAFNVEVPVSESNREPEFLRAYNPNPDIVVLDDDSVTD